MSHSTESVSDLDYWKNYLSDAEPCHFPVINDGSIGDISCSKRVDIELPTVSSLESFCEKNQISVDALFQGAWGLLLRCYCGIDAVCFGFVNEHVTISKTQTPSPCYLELAADTSILQILGIVELQIQESRKHVNYTLEEIQRALKLGNQSLFNTVVHISQEIYFDPISEREGDVIPQIQLQISLHGENANVSLTFHQSILSHSQALNVASAFTQALDCILHPLEATQRVCDIDLFSNYHRTQISSWNLAVRTKLALHCLHDDVQKQIDSIPDDTAVIAWDETFTYREVGDLSDRLANHLIGLGVGPEVFVPFLFEKSAWAVIAILAIVKAGGAIVGLDPSHPTQRLREIVGQTGARILLSSELNQDTLADAVDEIVIVNRDSLEALPANITTPKTLVTSSNALYITFTSGSTGQPKGVIVEHGSYNSTMLVLKKEMDIGRYTRVLQAASFAFSPSILETIGALAFGACVCIPSQAAREANFGAVLSDMHINYATLTPTVLKAIKPDSVKALRNLMLFGEPMTEEAVRIWSKRTNLFNGWGSTEAGLITLKTDLRSLSDVANVGHCRGFARIVDPTDHERQVPIGAVGELILHAPWLARGYLNDPGKTAAVFLDRPDWLDYHDEKSGYGARFYKIGDLVRQNSDGSLSFAGRRDNMVKLRGQRLELGEVERNIRSLEGVQHSLVMVPTSGLLSEPRRLVAVIALTPSELKGSGDKSPPNKISVLSGKNLERAAAAVERFRESLLQKLPIYMVPTVWIMVHSIPLNNNSKLDRAGLKRWTEKLDPATYEQVTSLGASAEAPNTAIETLIRDVWAAVLDLRADKVGRNRSFISLGGDSISATSVIAGCREKGIVVTVQDIIRSKTIEELALRVTMLEDSKVTNEIQREQYDTLKAQMRARLPDLGIDVNNVEDAYPCSAIQQGLLLSKSKGVGGYDTSGIFEARCTEIVDIRRLQRAWQNVVDRHSALRTVFVESVSQIGSFDQVILKSSDVAAGITFQDDLHFESAAEVSNFLNGDSPKDYQGRPPHQMAIVRTTDGKIFFKLDADHTIIDGISMAVMIRDLEVAYEKHLCGPKPLYGDYIRYLHGQQVLSGPLDEDIRYWKEYLSDLDPCIFPPLIDTKPSSEPKQLQRLKIDLGSFDLQSFCKAHSVTLSNLFQTAWAIVLRAFTGSDDVCFGYLTSGRDVPVIGIQDAVGPFINMLICRLNLHGESELKTLLGKAQSDYLDSLPHQHCSLADIQHALGIAGGQGLFNTAMTFIVQAPRKNNQEKVIEFQAIGGRNPTEYDLLLEVENSQTDLQTNLTYWDSHISAEHAANVASTFAKVLESFVAPGQRVRDLDLFSERNRAQVFAWNAGSMVAVDSCLHDLVQEQAARRPKALAIQSWDGDLTYEGLDHCAARLAHHLRTLGVGKEMPVLLCFEKSLWMTVAMLATLKAGGVCVPVDPKHPLERLEHIVQDTKSNHVLVSQEYKHLFESSIDTRIVVGGSLFSQLTEDSESSNAVLPDNVAWIVFTSGSTGQPKGIVLTHKALSSTLKVFRPLMEIDSESRLFQFAAHTFDISVAETFLALTSGACLCIPSEHDRLNDLSRALQRSKTTHVFLVPTIAEMLKPEDLPDLSVLTVTGEANTHKVIETWAGKVQFLDAYGPAESTLWCTCSPALQASSSPDNIGTGRGAHIWLADLLDPNKLSPVGCIGEILVESPSLARGYLHEKAKTAESFIENPAWAKTAKAGLTVRRFYRTGDLARYFADGNIKFMGRKDGQIKRFGQRIELGEIERVVLNANANVKRAAVAFDKRDNGVLIAFLEFDSGVEKTEDITVSRIMSVSSEVKIAIASIERGMEKALPSYMIPTAFIPINYLPRLSSGKLDRGGISRIANGLSREQLLHYSKSEQSKTPPSNIAERELQKLWMEILKIDNPEFIGREDSFFALGGDSVRCMQLVARARKASIRLSVADVFKNPRLSDLATVAKQVVKEDEALVPFALVSGDDKKQIFDIAKTKYNLDGDQVDDIYPCTPLQEGLMLLSIMQQGSYIAQNCFSLKGVDIDIFKKAWELVYNGHSILRTRVVHAKSGSLQVVIREDLNWETGTCLESYLELNAKSPMAYGERMTRYAIIKNDSGEDCFVWTLHHSIYDGWSLALVQQEVSRAYNSLLTTPSIEIAVPPPYSKFIKYLHELKSSPTDAMDFWRSHLAGMPSSYPSVSEQQQFKPRSMIMHEISLTRQRQTEITASTVIRAAWALILARYSESTEVVFGITQSGRSAPVPDIDRMTGPTIATVPVQVSINSSQSLLKFLASVQDSATKMIPFEHFGLQNIKRVSKEAERACSLIQSLLVVQPVGQYQQDDQNSIWQPIDFAAMGNSFLTYPLNVECLLGEDTARVRMQFDDGVIESAQAKRMAYQFSHVVKQLQSLSPLESVESVEIFSPEDREDVLAWNSQLATVVDSCVHDEFSKSAQRHLNKQAVLSWDAEFTYRQLDTYSSILAEKLLGLQIGIGAETLVPLLFDKSAWMIVAMLGVLKSGAAFVPLDPSQPRSRALEVFEETKARLVLCSGNHVSAFEGTVEVILGVKKAFFEDQSISAHKLASHKSSGSGFDDTSADDTSSNTSVDGGNDSNGSSSLQSSQVYDTSPSDDTSVASAKKCYEAYSPASPNSTAYIIFTSGSTGRSKGVVVSHKTFCTQSKSHRENLHIDENSRVLNHSSYAFDGFLTETLTVLLAGGTACVVSESTRMSPPSMARAINDMNVSWTFFTPSYVELLHPSQFSSVKYMFVGGEPVPQNVLKTWADKLHLANIYGPTETCVYYLVNNNVKVYDKANVIGRPIEGRCWVVDQNGRHLSPVGCVGELYIQGPALAKGYFNNPEQTNSTFIMAPRWLSTFDLGDGEDRRVYRTGDLVRLTNDGVIEFVGRVDTQVKIRGNRVELGEVEYKAKSSHPEVANVVVEKVDNHLVAFLILANQIGEDVSTGAESSSLLVPFTGDVGKSLLDLAEALINILPTYMVPSIYVPMGSFPVAVTGKIDRKALKAMAASFTPEQIAQYSLSSISHNKRQPTTDIQKKLQTIWSTILEMPATLIGLDDNFFRLGGDSLQAMRLASTAKESGIALTVGGIFRNPRLVDMAEMAESLDNSLLSYLESTYSIERDLVIDAYPCTPLQEGLMVLSARQPGTYVAQYVFELPADSIDRFKAAWQSVVEDNPILRTIVVHREKIAGSTQVVLNTRISWRTAISIEKYLQDDNLVPMGYGEPLARFALIGEHGHVPVHFILSIHHAIYDDWTFSRLVKAVEDRLATGFKASSLRDSASSSSMKAFVKGLASLDEAAAAPFWTSQLEGTTPSSFPKLPHPAYKPLTNKTVRYSVKLSPQNSNVAAGAILGAWALLVARYSNSSDKLAIGMTVDSRYDSGTLSSKVMGPTLATVPFAVSSDQELAVDSFLNKLQGQLDAIRPFEQFGLQNIQQLGNDCAIACNFKTLISIREHNFVAVDSVSHAKSVIAKPGPVTYPIALDCQLQDDGILSIVAQYDSNIVSSSQMKRLLHQLEHVTNQMIVAASYPEIPLETIQLVSPEDKIEILQLNQNLPQALDIRIHNMISEHVFARPDSIAVCSVDETLSYSELDDLSSRLGEYLRNNMGVGPETLVPLLFTKSVWVVVAMVAVLKSGGGFVPMDPSHPAHRLREIVDQTSNSAALCSPECGELAASLAQTTFTVSRASIDALPPPQAGQAPYAYPPEPSNVAYVQFTSGSTGRPKGVVMTHSAFCTAAQEHGKIINLSQNSRVIHFSSYAFEACILEIVETLFHGGCICVAPESKRLEDLPGVMRELRANWAFLTPSFVRTIRPEDVPDLKTLVLGGEALGNDNIEVWSDKVLLINGYGPTECCIFSIINPVVHSGKTTSDMIGWSIGGNCWIVDPSDYTKMVPFGAVGELVLESFTMAREYLGDGERTSLAFAENPNWLNINGGRSKLVYRTGDLVQYNTDDSASGDFRFIGRVDAQVKINGQRLELGDIEHHIKASAGIIQHVAVEQVVLNKKGTKVLAAFFHLHSRKQADEEFSGVNVDPMSEELRKELKLVEEKLVEDLPAYMIPAFYIPLSNMPLLSSGKTDRKSLRHLAAYLSIEQLEDYSLNDSSKQTPQTPSEIKLQSLWSEILGIPTASIGIGDTFFRLGGDSIAAMRLTSLARGAGLEIFVADVFKHPKLEDLASVAVALEVGDEKQLQPFSLLKDDEPVDIIMDQLQERYDISSDMVEDIFPCSPLQEGLMMLSVKQPGSYMSQTILSMQPAVDIGRFQQAWRHTIARNSILRTRIVHTGLRSMQVVLKQNFAMPTWTLENSMDDYLPRDLSKPMDYGQILTRYAIINANVHERYFIWTAHHSLYDGWSLPLIIKEVESLYSSADFAKSPSPPSYSGFIEHLQSINTESAEDFWRSSLLETPLSTYPEPKATEGEIVETSIKHFVEISRPSGSDITLSVLIRAAWALVTAQYSDTDDVVFGAILTGRNASVKEIERMTGPSITTVPVRVSIDRQHSVKEFLQMIQDDATAMMPFEHTGLQHIKRLGLAAERACNINNLLIIQPGQIDLKGQLFRSDDNIARGEMVLLTYALIVECQLQKNGIQVEAQYRDQVILESQMHRMLHQFEHVLRQLNNAPDLKIRDLEIISPQDKKELLSWNNDGVLPPKVGDCIHSIISRQVESRRQTQAICSWDRDLTYSELNELSSKLGLYLRGIGIGPGTIVPLCFDKSAWVVVAILGVLKAGAAYVSLDAKHPMSRKRHLIDRVSAQIILVGKPYQTLSNAGNYTTIAVDEELLTALPEEPEISSDFDSPRNTAFVVFTSGSTGTPKGIEMSHGAFCTSSYYHAKALNITSESRVLQFASYVYDVSMGEILTTLMQGGCICIPTEEERLNNLASAITKMNVNWCFLTPTMAGFLKPGDVPSLKHLVLGGEHATKDNFETWGSVESISLINSYGPAETAIWCACATNVSAKTDNSNFGHRVGSLLWVTSADDPEKLSPIGCPGELLIEGNILANGYLNDTEKTAASFIENPAWSLDGSKKTRRFYRSGDLVKYNGNGTLSFIGRKDTQIKLHGQRIELGEIEHAIAAYSPDSWNIVVEMVQGSKDRDASLVVFIAQPLTSADLENENLVTPSAETKAYFTSTKSQLEDILPSHMIPAIFVTVSKIPLTAGGKTDRGELRNIWESMSSDRQLLYHVGTNVVQPPVTSMERNLRNICAKVLGIPQDSIGLEHNFLNIGGDSIMAMRLASSARSEHISLSVAQIFNHPKLKNMAAVARVLQPTDKLNATYEPFSTLENKTLPKETTHSQQPVSELDPRKLKIAPSDIEDAFEVSDYQAWVLGCGGLKPRGYYNYFILRLESSIDISNLRKACETTISHHPILRSIFISSGSKVFQLVLKTAQTEFRRYSRSSNQTSSSVIQQDIQRPVTLGEQIIRFMFIEEDDNISRLVMRISHAQYDGVCFTTIIQDIAAAYSGGQLSKTPPRHEFYHAVRSIQKVGSKSEAFWRNALAKSSMTNVIAHCLPLYQHMMYKSLKRHVAGVSSTNSEGITFASTVKAAWSLTLAHFSGQTDIVFGQVVTGRNGPIPGIERMVGPCMNVVPVRTTLSPSLRYSDLLQQVQSQHLASTEHELYGFQHIIERCTDWPKWTRFSSILQHTNFNIGANGKLHDLRETGDLKLFFESFSPPHDVSDIWVWSVPHGGDGFEIEITFSDAVGDDLARRMLDLLCTFIEAMLREPAALITIPAKSDKESSIPIQLPAPVSSNSFSSDITISTKTRSAVEDAWKSIFDINDAGAGLLFDTPYYELRGGTIVPVQLADAYRNKGFEVSVEDILDNATLAKQMLLLDQLSRVQSLNPRIRTD